jgi:L-ribulose-5-phosphate 3-epimerase
MGQTLDDYMIKCINSNSLQQAKDIPGLIEQADKSGFDHLELSLEPSGPLGEVTLDELRKDVDNSNLKIASLTSTQFDLFTLAGLDGEPERTAARDTVTQYLHRASSGNWDTMVLISAHEKHPLDQVAVNDYETAFNSLFQTLTDLTATAEELSVPLVIENPAAGLLLSPLELRDFIDQINSPYVGLCLNPTHAARLGNPLDWFHILDRRILALRLNLPSHSNIDAENPNTDLLNEIETINRNITLIYK